MHGDVGEAYLEHVDVEHPAERARADADVIADPERPGEEEHEAGKDVPEALLGGDAEHDPGDASTDEQVVDGHPEHPEDGEEDHHVADAGREQPYRGAGGRDGARSHEAAEAAGETPGGDDAGDEHHRGARPADHLQMHRRIVELAEFGAAHESCHRDDGGEHPDHPVVRTLGGHLLGQPVVTICPG